MKATVGPSPELLQNIITPKNVNDLLAWTADPAFCSGTLTPTAATIYLCRIAVPITTTFTNLLVAVSTGGTNYTNTQLGLYDSAGTFLRASAVLASAGTNTFGTSGAKTVPLSSPATVAGGPGVWVWAAVHAGTNSSTAFVLRASIATNNAGLNIGTAVAASRAGAYTGHATNDLATIGNLTPASITATAPICLIGVS